MSEGTLEEPHFVRFKEYEEPWHHQMPAALKHGGYGVTAARRVFMLPAAGEDVKIRSKNSAPSCLDPLRV